MESMHNISRQLGAEKKKARVITNGYRSGVLGDDQQKLINTSNNLKEDKFQGHLHKRQRNMTRNYGVSSQIEFSQSEYSNRPDKMHHEISPLWSRKKRVLHS